MKKVLNVIAAATVTVAVTTSCGILSNTNWDSAQLGSAMGKMATAASITDEQVIEICRQSTAQLDAQNTIENGAYNQRLQRLVKSVKIDGLPLNFKVYKTAEVNAFASADGSVRVYTGLMDIMDDDQLISILGHEIGHVELKHVKESLGKAYRTSAARDVINAAGTIGAVSQTLVGDLAETVVNSKFSQQNEYEADEYGFAFAIRNGHDPYSMYKALNKLVELSGDSSKASALATMFSSHPDSQKRATKVKALADQYVASKK